MESSISKKFSGKFIDIIEQGIKEGVFREDIYPEVVLEGIYALYVSIARSEQYKDLQVSPSDILLNTMGVYFRGFCTENGIESLDEHIIHLKASQKRNYVKKEMVHH